MLNRAHNELSRMDYSGDIEAEVVFLAALRPVTWDLERRVDKPAVPARSALVSARRPASRTRKLQRNGALIAEGCRSRPAPGEPLLI